MKNMAFGEVLVSRQSSDKGMMNKKFNLQTIYTPDFSCEINGNVLNYIEDLVIDRLLKNKKIIVGSKWRYLYSFNVGKHGDQIIVHYISQFSNDKMKVTGASCPYSLFEHGFEKNIIVKEFVRLLFESLKLFFQKNFKKVANEDVDDIYKMIDFELVFQLIKEPDMFNNNILFIRL